MPIATEKLTNRFLVIITTDKTACCMFPQALNCTEFGRMKNSNDNNNNSNIIMLLLCYHGFKSHVLRDLT